jgi:hypothetical protein
LVTQALGPVLLWSARREARRLAAGGTYEPQTIIERRNWQEMPEEMLVPAGFGLPQPACEEKAS